MSAHHHLVLRDRGEIHRQCAAVNCERQAKTVGLCHAHYERKRRGKPLDLPMKTVYRDPHERLIAQRRITDAGCWEWTGSLGGGDYGQTGIRVDGKRRNVRVHRLAYEIWKGPIPEGLHVCHHCDNRLCFNPDHLFVGNRFDNMRDASTKGRLMAGDAHLTAKLTTQAVREIRAAATAGADPRRLAELHGVARATIMDVLEGRTWRHVA